MERRLRRTSKQDDAKTGEARTGNDAVALPPRLGNDAVGVPLPPRLPGIDMIRICLTWGVQRPKNLKLSG